MEFRKPTRLMLAGVAAVVMLLDSITTWLAVRAGAVELNPVVAFFLVNIQAYIAFTLFKTTAGALLTYYLVADKQTLYAWLLIILIFIRAIAINITNL
ncbi:MAG: DUF5658 family protein [Desulfurococcales archaeon]|nr:DUF5658 family protein [Desulfurococcales archaeon]